MKKRVIACLQAVVVTAVAVAGTAFAADAGSESDPVASKSYVDDKISQVLNTISTGSATTEATGSSYTPVSVAVGKVLYGMEGTEIILRSGKGNIYTAGVDGVVDATTGSNLKTGATAQNNHILIVPRADGRGVKVSEAAWFLVKGDYSIK